MFDEEPLFENGPAGGAVNAGLMEFGGFNQPMMLPSDYSWYPPFDDVANVATMKLPDGKFMKLFLSMGIEQQLKATLPEEQWGQIPDIMQGLVGSYPAFSNGVTLGGHGITPDPQQNALGAGGREGGCQQCHVAGGVLESRVPVSKEQYVVVPGFGEDPLPLPVYKWKYYNVHALIDLGLTTSSEAVVDPEHPDYPADIDIDGDTDFVRESGQQMVLNWFQPAPCPDDQESQADPVVCFLEADTALARVATGLATDELTWSGGEWMPVLEPVTEGVENWKVLGYAPGEVIWAPDDPRIKPGDDEDLPVIEEAEWDAESEHGKTPRGELEVEGSAAPRDRVAILNGVTGDRLFSVRADRKDGTFEVERRLQAKRVPCTVKAQVGELVSEVVPVENAPANCVGQP
jgi:hypothetical protein